MTEVRMDVTGTLAFQAVESNCAVAEGDHLGDVECMKVFFPLDAPASGKIVWRVDLGAVVDPETVIAEIFEG